MPPKRLKNSVKQQPINATGIDKPAIPSICPVCEEGIIDATASRSGQDSIFCEGLCSSWLHRKCAGLSKQAFLVVSQPSVKFICPRCRLDHNEKELGKLKDKIVELEAKINDLVPSTINDHIAPTFTDMAATGVKYDSNIKRPIAPTADRSLERKYNLIVYGIEECQKGYSRIERHNKHLEMVGLVFTSMGAPFDPSSIRDVFRLGKFNVKRVKPRPLMVKFLRSADVNKVLTKIKDISPPYIIKPDRSLQARKREKCLMEVRWSLIQSGIERRNIRIKNSALFVNNNLLGHVDTSNNFKYEGDEAVKSVPESSLLNGEEHACLSDSSKPVLTLTPIQTPIPSGVPKQNLSSMNESSCVSQFITSSPLASPTPSNGEPKATQPLSSKSSTVQLHKHPLNRTNHKSN